jgi:hypothetical protein
LFIPEHLNQSKESLLKALKVVEKIWEVYDTTIQIYVHSNALKMLEEIWIINNYKKIKFLRKRWSVIADEDYLLLRKWWVELSRAAQSWATTIWYWVWGIPIIYTVPHKDERNNVEDYMFETLSADVFKEKWCPVINPTDGNIMQGLESHMLALLKYKNSSVFMKKIERE